MTSIYAEVDRPGEDSLQKGPQPSVGRQKTSERRLRTEENYCQELFDGKDWKGGKSFVLPIKARRSDFLRRRFWCLMCWQNDSFHCSPRVSCNWFVNWFIIIISFIFTREHSVLGCAKKQMFLCNKDGWTFTGCALKSEEEEEREEEQEIIIRFLWSGAWGDVRCRRSQPDRLICCAPVAWFRLTNWRVRRSAVHGPQQLPEHRGVSSP